MCLMSWKGLRRLCLCEEECVGSKGSGMVSVLHMRVLDGKLEGADSICRSGLLRFREMTVLISISLFFFFEFGRVCCKYGF